MTERATARELPTRAGVVVIGGGIVGCSVAYHLVRRGHTDVALLERQRLTSGTTWHAAGLATQLRATYNMSMLAKYSAELFPRLERETGMGTGFRQVGSLGIALSEARFEEFRRAASMARVCGFEVDVISPAKAAAMWPLMNPDGIVGAIHLPADGVANPTDVTMALAKGARNGGARIFEQVAVTDVLTADGRVTGVATPFGDIAADVVVNCTGMWARALGQKSGVTIPLHAAEHFYVITEPIPGLDPGLPVLRVMDEFAYVREDAGKLMVGFFEPGAKPWATDGIPEDFAFGRLPEDWDHLGPYVERMAGRLPVLRDAGIKLFFNGPESFTPDDRYILGEAPELSGYFVAAGFNSVGFQSGGGAGRALADWIVDGHAPMDLSEVDIRRFLPWQGNRRYLHDRTTEVLGLLYDMHWPFRQVETARGVRRSPLHDRVAAAGACFGEVAGWERANWYAPPGVEPRYEFSYGRQNWFPHSAEEHRAVREGVGLLDQTSFGKFLVQGRDAEVALQRLCANDVGGPAGRVVYTQWLNARGGIEADLTVTRLSETEFLVVTAAATQGRDLATLWATLNVQGPRSRELLSRVVEADLSNAGFPFGTSREVDLGYARVRATRITYLGELGWELMIPSEFSLHVYDTIVAAGEEFGLRHVGYHALNSVRMEKAYRHWGHDITDEDNPLDAGLGFCVAWDKPGGFVGRDALLRLREAGAARRLVTFVLDDPDPLLYHNEPIWRDGRLVGKITSGMFGHTLGRAIGLGWVAGGDLSNGALLASTYELEIANARFAATPHLRPPYDPTGARIRA
ncbi:MAG: dependent oxidoreductase [Chloroflexi bacterium]|nr:dependent oxidoreductase [Chloroflexota bacterium]